MKEVNPDDKWVENEEEAQPVEDPFAPGNVEVVTAITLLRIYDVMLAEFIEKHPAAGRRLAEKHGRGGLMGPPPAFNPDEVS